MGFLDPRCRRVLLPVASAGSRIDVVSRWPTRWLSTPSTSTPLAPRGGAERERKSMRCKDGLQFLVDVFPEGSYALKPARIKGWKFTYGNEIGLLLGGYRVGFTISPTRRYTVSVMRLSVCPSSRLASPRSSISLAAFGRISRN